MERKLIGGVAHVRVTCTGCGGRCWTQSMSRDRRLSDLVGRANLKRYLCDDCKINPRGYDDAAERQRRGKS